MDTRFVGWFVVTVTLIALLLNLVRLFTARPLDRVARAARWRAVLTTVVGAVVATQVARAAWTRDDSVWVATVPALAAAAGVIIAIMGERTLPRARRDTGTVRTAFLGMRTGLDTRGLERCFWAGLFISALALAVGWASSGPDGRSGARTWAEQVVTGTPYPGRAFTAPVLLGFVVLGLVTWAALRAIDARPALNPDEPDLDRALRLGSRIRVLRWSAGAALVTGGSLCLTIGMTMNDVTQRLRIATEAAPRAPWDWPQNGALAMSALGVVALMAALVAVLWDAPVIPRARGADVAQESATSRVGR